MQKDVQCESKSPSLNVALHKLVSWFYIGPSFFNFLIYEKIFKILESGGRNKNKNKIPKIVQLIKK